jgi:hypothetical protein
VLDPRPAVAKERYKAFVAPFPVLPLTEPSVELFAELRGQLRRSGALIPDFGLFIYVRQSPQPELAEPIPLLRFGEEWLDPHLPFPHRLHERRCAAIRLHPLQIRGTEGAVEVVRGNETLEGGKNWAIEMAGFQGTYHGETSTILSRCAKDTPVMDAATQSLGDVFLRTYVSERELEGDTVQLEQQGYVVWSGWVAGKDIGAIYVVAERCEEPSLRWHFGSAFENVRDTVNRYDPYGLLHAGAPSDEYEAEIGEILVRLQGVTSETDAMRLIRNVFARTLGAPPTDRHVARLPGV